MLKNQQLMSQKEKDYIASCFNRTANSLKSDINYEDILNGNKIEYDLKEATREFKMIFGKAYRRSRKHFRPSSSSETSFIENGLLITQLYETLSILKYLKIDNESFNEIENSIAVHLKNNFKLVINNPKIYEFLDQFISICSEPTKIDIMAQFYKNSACVIESEMLFNFLDKNLKNISVNSSFVSKALWSSNSGCLLGLFLLLKDQSLFNKIFQAFIASKVVDCEYLHKFISVLLSLCDQAQVNLVEAKLEKEKIADINLLMGKMAVNK